MMSGFGTGPEVNWGARLKMSMIFVPIKTVFESTTVFIDHSWIINCRRCHLAPTEKSQSKKGTKKSGTRPDL